MGIHYSNRTMDSGVLLSNIPKKKYLVSHCFYLYGYLAGTLYPHCFYVYGCRLPSRYLDTFCPQCFYLYE
eukprot:SAG11_NODE_2035_length_3897_cov_1.840179_4_plen_70_part_00